MRILTITPGLGVGGVERTAQNFSIGYAKLGHDVTVLNHGNDGCRRAYLENSGIRVDHVSNVCDEALSRLSYATFDVVHIHREGRRNDRETILLKWASRFAKLVVEKNVFFARDYGGSEQYIDLTIHMARVNQEKWLRRGGKQPSVVIPNPINVRDFAIPDSRKVTELRQQLGIPDDAFVYGRIGQAIRGKWDPIAVYAFSEVAGRNDKAWLLMVSPSEDIRQAVLRCKDNDVRRRIIMLDLIESSNGLGVCYNLMSCFLHAARQGESFGNVLVEALCYGVPVITVSRPHRDNAQTEVIRHGIDGYVVRSRRYLVEAMESLMQDHALRSRVRQGGRQGVIERFDLMRVCADALSLFEALLGGFPTPLLREPGPGIPAPIIEGIGRASPIELILARIYDWPWVDYCREQLRYLKRGYLARLRHP